MLASCLLRLCYQHSTSRHVCRCTSFKASILAASYCRPLALTCRSSMRRPSHTTGRWACSRAHILPSWAIRRNSCTVRRCHR